MSIQEFIDREITMKMSSFIGLLGSMDCEELHDKYIELVHHFDAEGEPVDILEYWSVSQELALQLKNREEAVTMDFYGKPVWGRTTSGQAIKMDSVIRDIYKERYLNS